MDFVKKKSKAAQSESSRMHGIADDPNSTFDDLFEVARSFSQDKELAQKIVSHPNVAIFEGEPSFSNLDLVANKFPDVVFDSDVFQFFLATGIENLPTSLLGTILMGTDRPDVVMILSEGATDANVAYAIASNNISPSDALDRIAHFDDWNVQELLSTHDAASEELLDTLSRSPLVDIRKNVAENPRTSPDTLHRMSEEELSRAVLIAVVENPRARMDTLDRAETSLSVDVQKAVIKAKQARKSLQQGRKAVAKKKDPDQGLLDLFGDIQKIGKKRGK